MRFCQSDGTPLVDAAPPVDPYKTMVASSDEIAAAMASPAADSEPAAKVDEEVLQLPPEADPKKTMYASEEEIRKEMEAHDDQVVELPPLAPEPPKFSEPSLSPPSFGDLAPSSPPPSPFSPSLDEPIANPTQESPFSRTTPPIPSPFEKPKPSTYEPPAQSYTPAADPGPLGGAGPFGQAESTPAWTPPAPIEPSYQNQEPMQNSPYTPASSGQNQTLAIVSLVLGIAGLIFCAGLTGIPAVITGMMARKKANNNPAEYGGAGLALGGIITGILGTLILLLVVAYIIFVFFIMAGSIAFS